MTTLPADVLSALARAAIDATGASAAWIVVPSAGDDQPGGELRAVAVAGTTVVLAGQLVASADSAAAYSLASGQPLAVQPGRGGPLAHRTHPLVGADAGSVCAVPCDSPHGVVGVLELVDKTDGRPFTIDDIEITALLAGVVAVVLSADTDVTAPLVLDPAELGGELAQLHSADPSQYRRLAQVVSALLAHA